MPVVVLAVRLPDNAGIGLTVNKAASDVATPPLLLQTAWYCLLSSNADTANVNVPFVAPVIFVHVVPLVEDCHCTVGDGTPFADELKLTF